MSSRLSTLMVVRRVAFAACVVGLGALPGSAGAVSVSLSSGTLAVVAGAGESLDVTARPLDASSYEVDFGSAVVSAPAGCTLDLGAVVCPSALVSTIDVTGDTGDDRVSVRGSVVLHATGGGGDDDLRGGDGADDLKGGPGADFLDGRAGGDVEDGGVDGDQVLGSAGADTLTGGDGQDVVDGGDSADEITGGAGDDSLTGGAGADTIDGGEGADQIDAGDEADHVTAGAGADAVFAGAGVDEVDSGSGSDVVDGGTGDDVITGGDDSDTLIGGSGADRLDGGAGGDTLDGQAGGDAVTGGDADDTLVGGADGDRLTGGAGTDTLDDSGASSALDADLQMGVVRGTVGTDTLGDVPEVVLGGSFGDTLRAADSQGSTLSGGGGDDRLFSGARADRLIGDDGTDSADYSARTTGVTIAADGQTPSGAPGEGDVVDESVEVLIGGSGKDLITGSSGRSKLFGGAGDDHLIDLLDGERDTLDCGDGNDIAEADRSDEVLANCERWSDGALLLQTVDPFSVAVRSKRLAVGSDGRLRVSIACGPFAIGQCRMLVSVQLRQHGRWRAGVKRSVLVTPGRRRNVALFLQRRFAQLAGPPGTALKARAIVTARDAIGRTATAEKVLPLALPSGWEATR